MLSRLGRYWIRLSLLCGLPCVPLWSQSPQELAAEAARALQNQDYAAAEKGYEQLLKLVPDVAEMHSNHGMACYHQQKSSCAEGAFARALELKPDLFLPNWLLGRLLVDRGDYEAAYPLVERAYELGFVHEQVRKLLAATLVGLKRYHRAIAVYRSALASDSSDPDLYYGLGKIYLQFGQETISRLGSYKELDFAQLLAAERSVPDEDSPESDTERGVKAQRTLAINAYKDALSSGVEVRGARVEYAELEVSAGRRDLARTALQTELQRDPWSYEAHFQLARVALLDADPLGAAQSLDRAASIRPEYFDPLPGLRRVLPDSDIADPSPRLLHVAEAGSFGAALILRHFHESSNNRAEASRWSAMAVQARERLQSTAEFGPEGGGLERDSMRTAQYGVELLRRKRYERGVATLLSIRMEPGLFPEVDLELARALYRLARYNDLIEMFSAEDASEPELIYLVGSGLAKLGFQTLEAMVQLDPESARAHQILGEAFDAQERYLESAASFEAAVQRRPQDSELRFLLGTSYYKQMLFPSAAREFERTIELDSRNAEAHLMLGDALLQTGDYESALIPLKKVLVLDAGITQAYVSLGRAYRALGNFELAAANLERGVLEDVDGTIHYQLFLIYRQLGRLEKAKSSLEKSQQLRKLARNEVR